MRSATAFDLFGTYANVNSICICLGSSSISTPTEQNATLNVSILFTHIKAKGLNTYSGDCS